MSEVITYEGVTQYMKDNAICVDCHNKDVRRRVKELLQTLDPTQHYEFLQDRYDPAEYPYAGVSSRNAYWVLYRGSLGSVWTIDQFEQKFGRVETTVCGDLADVL